MDKPRKPHLDVRQPQPGDTVPGAKYKKGDKESFFVGASGRLRGSKELIACLIDEKKGKAYSGKMLKRGMHWIIGFEELPTEEAKYHLVVIQTGPDAETGKQLAVT